MRQRGEREEVMGWKKRRRRSKSYLLGWSGKLLLRCTANSESWLCFLCVCVCVCNLKISCAHAPLRDATTTAHTNMSGCVKIPHILCRAIRSRFLFRASARTCERVRAPVCRVRRRALSHSNGESEREAALGPTWPVPSLWRPLSSSTQRGFCGATGRDNAGIGPRGVGRGVFRRRRSHSDARANSLRRIFRGYAAPLLTFCDARYSMPRAT